MAHVTGGGLLGNLPRALGGLGARLDPIMEGTGGLRPDPDPRRRPESEMRAVFNLGVGFCAVVPPEVAERGAAALRGAGCEAWRIGEVVEAGGVEFV